jgi:hypothetical protein
MNVNVKPQLFNQEALKQNTLQDHEETLILSLVVNLPIAYSTTSPRNNTFKELRYHLQERKNKTRAKE